MHSSFLDAIQRVSEPAYRPTQDDILHTRVKTTGIVDIAFQMKSMDFKCVPKMSNISIRC